MKCWSTVANPGRIKNLPPYCFIERCTDEISQEVYYQIVPNVDSLYLDIRDGEVFNYDECPNDYRGLVVYISDHGNVSLLFRFKNGNTREIWSA